MRKLVKPQAFVPAMILMAAWSPGAMAQETVSLNVHAEGLRSTKGQVIFCLWRESAVQGFPTCEKGKPAAKLTAPATDPVVTFTGLTPGKYAVSYGQDDDGDGHPQANFLGIPTSAVGLSNNPKVSMKPPSFKSAGLDISADTSITIKAIYPGS